MKRVSEKKFLEQLTWVCEQAKFHGFVVEVSIFFVDVTVPPGFDWDHKCKGKRHELIFTKRRGSTK